MLPQKAVVRIKCFDVYKKLRTVPDTSQVLKKCQLILSSTPFNSKRLSSWSKAEPGLEVSVPTPRFGPFVWSDALYGTL